ncbi:hypothetical protein TNCV_1731351 [Trichonephila clavipes]|nr:hypothetical protein TNCV_1731351 [Trichonephila clavipes]
MEMPPEDVTKLFFVEPKAKNYTTYYQKKVSVSTTTQQQRARKDFIHQDSASSHTAKSAIKRLKDKKKKFSSDEIDFEIAVLPLDASELTDEDKGDENDENSREITENDVPGSLVVRTCDSFQSEQSFSISTTRNRKRQKDISHLGDKE